MLHHEQLSLRGRRRAGRVQCGRSAVPSATSDCFITDSCRCVVVVVERLRRGRLPAEQKRCGMVDSSRTLRFLDARLRRSSL